MAIILHEGGTFMVSESSGDVTSDTEHGYYHLDTRFLSRRELRFDGLPVLAQDVVYSDWHDGFFFMTNPSLSHVPRGTLSVVVHRVVAEGVYEDIDVENFGDSEARFRLGLRLDADFAYILSVKHKAMTGSADWAPSIRRTRESPDSLVFELVGADPLHQTRVSFNRPIDELSDNCAQFDVKLGRRERLHLHMVVTARLGNEGTSPVPIVRGSVAAQRAKRRGELDGGACSLECDHPVLSRAFAQALYDISSLRIKAEDRSQGHEAGSAIAAGIPWYMDLFGRDSLIASYQTLFADPSLARGTLEGLARLQGTKVDPLSGEAPGKILHEYRHGSIPEAARKIIPKFPYYGTIDATPLYLITLSEYARWTADLDFVRRHLGNIEAAVDWMRKHGDKDGDGFLEYALEGGHGLANQGWKDSPDSVRFRDGRIAQAPIALVEVQGYQYQALVRSAELLSHIGKPDVARELSEWAARLRPAIRDSFWLKDRGYFAEALDGKKQRVDSLTSNPAHLLWCDAVDEAHARAVGEVLLSPAMFSGYGIRTMGEEEGGYNPLSYHNGSVWPHDCSLALAGLAHKGLDEMASRVADGMLNALGRLDGHQPPEVFCGYSADRFPAPVKYLHANRPQAWASGSVILLARCVAGLNVDALTRRISVRPLTIHGLTHLVLRNLRIAHHWVTLEIEWRDGVPEVQLTGLGADWQRDEPGSAPATLQSTPPSRL